jgi:hypothetical protein
MVGQFSTSSVATSEASIHFELDVAAGDVVDGIIASRDETPIDYSILDAGRYVLGAADVPVEVRGSEQEGGLATTHHVSWRVPREGRWLLVVESATQEGLSVQVMLRRRNG